MLLIIQCNKKLLNTKCFDEGKALNGGGFNMIWIANRCTFKNMIISHSLAIFKKLSDFSEDWKKLFYFNNVIKCAYKK